MLKVFENFNEIFCILDEKFNVCSANKNYFNIFGEKELPYSFLSNLYQNLNSDSYELITKYLIGKRFNQSVEIEYISPVNKKYWLEVFHCGEIKSNNQYFQIFTLRDITNKKLNEIKLLKKEEMYRSIFNQANDAMFVSYLNYAGTLSNFTEVNLTACTILEYTRDELLLMNPYSVIFNNFEGNEVKIIDQLKVNGFAIFDTFHLTKSGRQIPVEINSHLIEFNEKPAVIFISRDVTQREEAKKKLEETGERLRSLALHIQNIREEERTLIAREIHDDLGQMLTYLKIQINLIGKRLPAEQNFLIDKINSSMKLIDDAIESVQRITEMLRPNVLDELGLLAAIEWQIKDFSSRTGIICIGELPKEEFNLSKEKSTAIFRIFQEALTNAARHSNANRIKITLKEFKNNLILEVNDNGKGITASQINNPKSLGILGMKERAMLFGGSVIIKSSMNSGTLVHVEIPINNFETKDD